MPRSLDTYRSKRDFRRTPEPAGRKRREPVKGLSFVVQKHAARALHYDFRLELDGVMLSWAVPKGPSLDPSTKRLAMQTEDHPLEYRTFEGVIPAGQYGGGTVMVWDEGTWEPEGDPREAYRKKRLTFVLHGKKLRGRWHLVRVPSRDGGERRAWLLFKGKDEAAARGAAAAVVDREPDSVRTGRSLEEIAGDPRRDVWHSSKPDDGGGRTAAKTKSTAARAKKKKKTKPREPRRGTQRKQQDPLAGLSHVRMTNPDRVLYPDPGLTKLQLAVWYARVAERMLPHVVGRPLTLVRCPEGQTGECFFQKHAGRGLASGIRKVEIAEGSGVSRERKRREYMVVDDLEGILGLVQMSTLEIHVWGSRDDRLEHPDRLVFDVDPDVSLPWQRVVEAARRLRERLGELGLTSFLQTTGGKGLHVVLPVARRMDWDGTRAFCRAVASDVERREPKRYVTTMSKHKRHGKIFLDHFRNARGATAIAPWSTRARPGAPVATPIAWDEADDVRPDGFTVTSLVERLAEQDPWHDWFDVRQSVTRAMRAELGLE
jgi:bifunctional non-homologous end joining protein LigD